MTIITTRKDLLDMAARFAPTTACERAVRQGSAIVLGAFRPPEDLPYWLVEIKLTSGRMEWVAVRYDERTQFYHGGHGIGFLKYKHWIGQADGKRPLIDGDIPKDMAMLRSEQLALHSRPQSRRAVATDDQPVP